MQTPPRFVDPKVAQTQDALHAARQALVGKVVALVVVALIVVAPAAMALWAIGRAWPR